MDEVAEPPSISASLHQGLVDIVGRPHVLVDPSITAGFARDWTGRFTGSTPAVIRPGSAEEVAAVLRACADAGAAVVPQGGNTGLVAGSVALEGELTLSLTRLGAIDAVDPLAAQVTVGAGAALAAVQDAARAAGLEFGIDLAARDSATIGGMVATNAGGLNVIRRGPMRQQITGIEAICSSGAVIGDLRGLLKDNTGYHWPSVLCGSEGTLAVVTRARLRLVPRDVERAVALIGFDTNGAAVAAAAALRDTLIDVHAIELMTARGVALVCDTLSIAPPFATPSPIIVLVELAGADDVVDRLGAAVALLPGVRDTAVAVDAERRAALWRYRESHSDAIALLGPVHKLDVTLPLPQLASFLDDVVDRIARARPDANVWLFGHAGDGNIHVNITGVAPDDDRLDELVLADVAARGGSISAEHGIGRAKLPFLHLNRTAAEIDAMRALKRALDPAGILNPGVLLP